jgi:hypothetical protein
MGRIEAWEKPILLINYITLRYGNFEVYELRDPPTKQYWYMLILPLKGKVFLLPKELFNTSLHGCSKTRL